MSLPKKLIRDSKSRNEKNDCAVKAVAIVSNTPYEVVHQMMTEEGRKPRRGTPYGLTERVLTKRLGCWVKNRPGFPRVTVRKLPLYLPRKGRFLVRTSRHILAVVDGKVHDWTEGRLHRVIAVYEVSL